ncbi:MAG: M24 family metallopeptidase [Fuerstiella sp.]|nr:M24 family metallopeptidase [Fuerstiella sp.]
MSGNSREEQRPKRLLVQDAARLQDVELKHERVRQLLKASGSDALLLQNPENIAWFTAGVDRLRCVSENCTTSLFVTSEARLFATNSTDSAQIFEREAFGLGFQLKQREWFQPHDDLVSDLCRGRKVISDRGINGVQPAADAVRTIRLPLTELEVTRMRLLSRIAVHAVEATGHHLRRGVTESEVAGEVSHRLLKRTVAAVRIQVCADGRNERYRHWTFGEQAIEDFAVISCVARRWGLHVGVTRTVCLEKVPPELWRFFQRAMMLQATGIFFSRHGQILGKVWKKVHRIYEKFGMANEWQLADQADVIAYSECERQLTPHSEYQLPAPVPVFWHPSVGPALVGDTVLLHESSNEQLTMSSSWPHVPVQVKGQEILCPGILRVRSAGPPTETSQMEEAAASLFDCPQHPPEDGPLQVESVWEMEFPPLKSIQAQSGGIFPGGPP